MRGEGVTGYERDGFAGPFPAFAPDEMAALRPRIDELFANQRRRMNSAHAYFTVEPDALEERDADLDEVWNAHRRDRLVFDLATHPAVLAEITRVAGPTPLLWRTQFWIKEPGARRFEWHQDTYPKQGLHDRGIVTAWIAIDEVPSENAVQLLPGSHRTVLPIDVFDDERYRTTLRTSRELPRPPVDGSPVTMSLRPGEFFVFHQLVVHGSPPNDAGTRRAGLAARFLPTGVDPSGIADPCMRVAGHARPRGLRLVTPPPRSAWAANSTLLTRLRLGRRPWQRAS
jgi:ectoine hydroxylase-related dioxygenase (phytanoyl-CoA dioxygenase family)